MHICAGYDLQTSQPLLVIDGDTFPVKDRLSKLGCSFRRSTEPVTSGQPYWQIEDTADNRAALRAAFPFMSGWYWLPEIGHRGPGDHT